MKFSPPLEAAISRRIADLLICEHIAHGILRDHRQNTSTSYLISGAHRLFLEVERFDRVALQGRKGVISLRALDLEFVGNLISWTDTAEHLFSQKRIDNDTLHRIRWLEIFGQMIANTDMHHGNLSFFTEGEKLLGLTPVYDMLPMLYAPQQNQLIARSFKPPLPKPSQALLFNQAREAALCFWNTVQTHPSISPNFKKVGEENFKILSDLVISLNPPPA